MSIDHSLLLAVATVASCGELGYAPGLSRRFLSTDLITACCQQGFIDLGQRDTLEGVQRSYYVTPAGKKFLSELGVYVEVASCTSLDHLDLAQQALYLFNLSARHYYRTGELPYPLKVGFFPTPEDVVSFPVTLRALASLPVPAPLRELALLLAGAIETHNRDPQCVAPIPREVIEAARAKVRAIVDISRLSRGELVHTYRANVSAHDTAPITLDDIPYLNPGFRAVEAA